MMFEVTYTGNKTDHIWVPGYEENPAIYIPGNCEAGQYGADGAGTLLEHVDRQPAGARAPHAPQPDRRQVLRRQRRGPGVPGRHGALQRREVQPAEAPAAAGGARTRTTPTASASTRVSRAPTSAAARSRCLRSIRSTTRIRTRRRMKAPCAADRRHNFNLSSVVVSPGVGSGFVDMADQGLADRPHLPGAQRLGAHAWRERRPRADGRHPARRDRAGHRSVSAGGPARLDSQRRGHQHAAAVVQHGRVHEQLARRLGQCAEGLPVWPGVLERGPLVLAQHQLRSRAAASRSASRRSTCSTT